MVGDCFFAAGALSSDIVGASLVLSMLSSWLADIIFSASEIRALSSSSRGLAAATTSSFTTGSFITSRLASSYSSAVFA